MEVVDGIVAPALILVGALLTCVGALGNLRFSDVFVRMHTATKPATLGWTLVVIGTAIRLDGALGTVALLVLALAMQFLTAPVAAHLVGRAVYGTGAWAARDAVVDELADGAGEPGRLDDGDRAGDQRTGWNGPDSGQGDTP